MSSEVRSSLPRIPFEPHRHSVWTYVLRRKRRSRIAARWPSTPARVDGIQCRGRPMGPPVPSKRERPPMRSPV
jgi:hypothetical protein